MKRMYPSRLAVSFTLLGSMFVVSILPQAAAQNQTPASATPPLTVRDFGAVGDGAANDTAALQKSIAATGGMLLPKGVYRIDQTLEVKLDQTGFAAIRGNGDCRLVMAGSGPAIRLIGTHDGTADPASVKPDVWEHQRMPTVSGIEIVGAHPEASGVEAKGTMQLILSQVTVRNALHGIHLSQRNRNVVIALCHIYENRGIGIYYDHVNLHQSNITNCHVSYNRQGGIVLRGGDVRNVHVGSCDIEGNMANDGQPTANVLLDATGGSLGEIAITGCTIQHDHRAPKSANIRVNFRSTERPFTPERRHGNLTISANVLSDVQTNIDIQHARGFTIVGNTIWKGYASNLHLKHCQSFVVSSNTFDMNPRYGYGDGMQAKLGVLIEESRDAVITGNVLHGTGKTSAALHLKKSHGLNVTGNSIFEPHAAGILLEEVRNSRISGSLIKIDPRRRDRAIVSQRSGPNQLVDNLVIEP